MLNQEFDVLNPKVSHIQPKQFSEEHQDWMIKGYSKDINGKT